MADLKSTFLGIESPNPFWLASAPPTDKEYNVRRAFEAGWGGVVWKTLGEAGPPIVNVNGPRYGVVYGADRRLLGLNNIELITDRPLDVNLREIKAVKRDWPDRAVVVSLMVPCEEEPWKKILGRVEVGEGAKIGAGSVVLQDVPAHTTVAGVPAEVVGRSIVPNPAAVMDQSLDCYESLESSGL